MPCGRRIGPEIGRTPSRPHLKAPVTTATLQKTSAVDTAQPPILRIEDLVVEFRQQEKVIRAANHVSIAIRRGETLGIVGESGSGKSVLCRSILRLLPSPPAFVRAGRITFNGRDLLKLSDAEMEQVRGAEIAMVFQNPMNALNPVWPIGDQISEGERVHRGHQFTRRSGSGDCPIEACRHTKPRNPRRRVSAPMVWRHVTASRHRDGNCRRAETHTRR